MLKSQSDLEQERDRLTKALHQRDMKLMSLGVVPDTVVLPPPGTIGRVDARHQSHHDSKTAEPVAGFVEVPLSEQEARIVELQTALKEALARNVGLRARLRSLRDLRSLNPLSGKCSSCKKPLPTADDADDAADPISHTQAGATLAGDHGWDDTAAYVNEYEHDQYW